MIDKEMYANIIVDISHEKLDRTFQYKVPKRLEDENLVGKKVAVPFGRGNKLIEGYVIELTDAAEYDKDKIKEIQKLVKDSITVESYFIKMANYIRQNYGSTMITALKTVLPVKESIRHIESRLITCNVSSTDTFLLRDQFLKKKQVAKSRLFDYLGINTTISYAKAVKDLGVSPKTLTLLEENQYIRITEQTLYRNPLQISEYISGNQETNIKKELSEIQQDVFQTFVTNYEYGNKKPMLLHGITGSGKTEVYMEMIDYVLEQGKEAIVLIPEIALTYQTIKRFYERFGDVIAVINSKLSKGERYDQFEKARNGQAKIMIGPRSALFTPFQNLGIIVIDEEHESSYKSDAMPRFHARDVALWIGKEMDAAIVLGSATPSLYSYYKAQTGEFLLANLNYRFNKMSLPDTQIVDLRQELREGNRSIFSRELKQSIFECLQNEQQAMLFINRRGYAGFISCRACGYVVKCSHCDVSLTDHNNGILKCHYCGYEVARPKLCPSCGSKYLLGFKAGTKQIEELLNKEFPTAKVLRMDADTTKNKDDYQKILSRFASKQADILVGTQMIVKGHDFKDVTLVGVLAADLSLAMNDYQASERTFQLITQAAGRAGRGNLDGKVVIQTYQPDHYALLYAKEHDYVGFYQEEIAYREIMSYPPVENMLAVMVVSKEEEYSSQVAKLLSDSIKPTFQDGYRVIGPTPATIFKVNDRFRFLIYIKAKEYEKLVFLKDKLESLLFEKQEETKKASVYFDFNPMNGY